jgi:uncharacterized damage-inducible protein DinB
MDTAKWFERQFDFRLSSNDYVSVYKRLQQAAGKLLQITASILPATLIYKPGGKWSVNEHAGHLSLLEPLWRQRFIDIRNRKPVLSPADLENKATTEAGFNNNDFKKLIETFINERNTTLLLLDSMNEEDKTKTSLHPRLQLPMRIIDLAYFVAEHDEHHLLAISEIIRVYNN